MTNEELVASIQSGKRENISLLWEEVQGFTRSEAFRFDSMLKAKGIFSCDISDLVQSGYISLCKAVETYKPEKEMSFLGWLLFYLKKGFAEAAGITSKSSLLFLTAKSIDEPIGNDEEDSTIEDRIADEHDYYSEVEDSLLQKQLHKYLEEAIETLPDRQGKSIRYYYFEDIPTPVIAERFGITPHNVERDRYNALPKLKRLITTTNLGSKIRDCMNYSPNYYLRVSAKRFNTTHTSAVEQLTIEKLDKEDAFFRRYAETHSKEEVEQLKMILNRDYVKTLLNKK